MGRVGLVMLVGGAFLAYFGYKEYRLSKKVQSTPQRISAADLEKNGPGDNANVVLVDYAFGENYFRKAKKNSDANWTKVWIPTLSSEATDPTAFQIIVVSDKIKSESNMASAELSNQLSGVIINEIDSLGSEESKLLKQNYPKLNLDKVWIIEHDRTIPIAGKAMLMAGGGLALVVGGGVMLLGAARNK